MPAHHTARSQLPNQSASSRCSIDSARIRTAAGSIASGTVQASEDRHDHILIVLGSNDAREHRRRAFGEQVHRFVAPDPRRPSTAGRFPASSVAAPEGRPLPRCRAFPAGRENPQFRAGAEKG